MSGEVAVATGAEAINLVTGEVYADITAISDEELGRLWVAQREAKAEVERMADVLNDETLRRMDENATWTMHVDNLVDLTGPSPAVKSYDAEVLRTELRGLVATEVLKAEPAGAAIGLTEPKLKVMKGGLDKLLKLGTPEVTEAIARAEKPAASRRVTVKLKEAHVG